MRRLAAVDMHGSKGTTLRRRLILAEFLGAVAVGLALGLYLLITADSWLGAALGVYVLGVAANYVPLAAHAVSLRAPERLRAELRGVDLREELRYYTGAQFLVFVPLLFLWFEARR